MRHRIGWASIALGLLCGVTLAAATFAAATFAAVTFAAVTVAAVTVAAVTLADVQPPQPAPSASTNQRAAPQPNEPPARPRILGIGHVAFRVSDVDAARRFYGDLIGLVPIEASGGTLAYAIGSRQQVRLEPGFPAPPSLPDDRAREPAPAGIPAQPAARAGIPAHPAARAAEAIAEGK